MYESADSGRPPLARPVRWSVALARWAGFWSAILLPLVHVSLLVAVGFTAASTPVILSLWAANALAFLLGRRHTPRGRTRLSVADGDGSR